MPSARSGAVYPEHRPSELTRSDRRVRELSALVGQPQNAVSYHLGRPRADGLVSMHRSSADRRDSYYRIELTRRGQLLAATGAALHPGLLPALATAPQGHAAPFGVPGAGAVPLHWQQRSLPDRRGFVPESRW